MYTNWIEYQISNEFQKPLKSKALKALVVINDRKMTNHLQLKKCSRDFVFINNGMI